MGVDMTEFEADETLDVTGLSCPMPVVKTKQKIDELPSGALLEVIATDSGSMSDINGWASATEGVQLHSQIEDDDGDQMLYKHYVEKIP